MRPLTKFVPVAERVGAEAEARGARPSGKRILLQRQAATERCKAVRPDASGQWGGIGDGGGFPPTFHIGTTRVHAQGIDDRKQLTLNGLLALEEAGVEPVRACFCN